MESQTLLLAAVRAGTHPDIMLYALSAVPHPHLPSLAAGIYEQVMAALRQHLDKATLEILAPSKSAADQSLQRP